MKLTRPAFLALFGLGLIALLATACDNGDTIVNASTTTASGISTSGSGRVAATPDVVFLLLGAEVELRSVAEARDAAARAMQSVIDSLKSNRVDEKDIQTTQLSIQPQYDFTGRVQVLRGYKVTNVISVKLTKIDSAGKVIDDAARAGGNAFVVRSVRFAIDDPTELQAQARELAMKQAKARADELAKHANVELGRPISIVEGFQSVIPQAAAEALGRGGDTGGDTPIQTGELEVVVTVNVLYAIE